MKKTLIRRILGMVLTTSLILGSCLVPAMASQFRDIDGHWAEKYITAMVNAGGISGYKDGTFRPNDPITSTEFMSILLRVTGNPPAKGGDWTTSVLKKAYSLGVYVYWSPDGSDASANYPMTKEEAALVLTRAAEGILHETVPYDEAWDGGQVFKDITSGTLNVPDVIESCYAMGLISGDTSGNFRPNQELTRAEAVVMISRLVGMAERAKVTMPLVQEVPQYTPLPDGSNVGMSGTVYPYEGAVDARTGKVITRDPNTGVLGFGNGQKGNIYYGIDTVNFDDEKVKIKAGYCAADDYDNFRVGDAYLQKNGYVFWEQEWWDISSYARQQLPKPDASMVGTKADINGKIIAKNDTTTPAFWEVISVADFYTWNEIDG
ncbi:S-layer homology domain-containing protein [Anaerotignum lactatifermentans]|uniref:S-layer homology domain-containing protein n=1 Tax=Anaerotignum lactatifermentans TaxID=160404 RepID=UPI00266C8F47|nr:S-layer homology domain-containing protein [Anaerotignum lactatifermentans]